MSFSEMSWKSHRRGRNEDYPGQAAKSLPHACPSQVVEASAYPRHIHHPIRTPTALPLRVLAHNVVPAGRTPFCRSDQPPIQETGNLPYLSIGHLLQPLQLPTTLSPIQSLACPTAVIDKRVVQSRNPRAVSQTRDDKVPRRLASCIMCSDVVETYLKVESE
jgi:hypothetical protein